MHATTESMGIIYMFPVPKYMHINICIYGLTSPQGPHTSAATIIIKTSPSMSNLCHLLVLNKKMEKLPQLIQ